ncbi:MAG: phage baseplate assembly protein V [Duganella sp.]
MKPAFCEAGVTLKFGTVSASRPGFARIRLPDTDNMRTMWLPVAYPKTLEDQCYWTYDPGEHVAVLLDAQGEDGVILGAIFSDEDTAPVTDNDKFGMRFKDGAQLEYDRATHTLTVTGVENVVVEAATAITLKAGAKVTVDAPDTEISGNAVVMGKLTYQCGLQGSGGAAAIEGDVSVDGNVSATGSVMDSGGNSNHHKH